MLKILNEKVKKTPEDIEREYSNCKYILINYGDLQDPAGYLYCISESADTFDDISREIYNLTKKATQCMLLGSYENGGAVGVQYEIKK